MRRGYALPILMLAITSAAAIVTAGLPPMLADAESIDRDFAREQLRQLRNGAIEVARNTNGELALRWDNTNPNSPRAGFHLRTEGPSLMVEAYAESPRERCTQRTDAELDAGRRNLTSLSTSPIRCVAR